MSNEAEQTWLFSTALLWWRFPLFSASLGEKDMDTWLKPIQHQHLESVIRAICSPTWLTALAHGDLFLAVVSYCFIEAPDFR